MYYRISLVSFLRILCALGTTLAIWPIPRTITTGQETLLLSRNFSIFSELSETPRDLTDAIDRTKTRLFNDNLGRLVVGRGSSDTPSFNSSETLQSLRFSLISGDNSSITSISKESTASFDIRNESYSLNVPADGSNAILEAASTLGLLRGLTTFEQLWYTFSGQVYAVGMPLRVQDFPSFPYRGFSLDTSRNFYPISDIKRTLDAMSWVKLNTLYWHVVDSHSFPLEVSAFPELSQMGAYSTAQVYSDDDVQDVISYAAARGIDVVLELDTPGHETAIGLSHPEHIACYLASPWSEFANENRTSCGAVAPRNPLDAQFLRCTRLFCFL